MLTGTSTLIHPAYAGMNSTIKGAGSLLGNGYISPEELGSIPPKIETTTPTIKEKKEEGIFQVNQNAGNNLIDDSLKAQQQAQWQREDEIRKETQEREDTAYQRTVEDMKKAGINPNLVNVQPAASGGGIMSASQMDSTQASNYSEEMNRLLEEWKTELENSTTIDQKTKDRWAELGERLLQGAINIGAMYFLSKAKK